MENLLRETLPHAPRLGLYVAPNIPKEKVAAALEAYAPTLARERVIALYDATIFGSGKDGVLFLADRLVYQNNPAAPPQTIPYRDVAGVEMRPMLLGGRKIVVAVDEARTTVSHELDFSAHREAAEPVFKFLEAIIARPAGDAPVPPRTDLAAVRAALDRLVKRGQLSEVHRRLMLNVLELD